MPKNATDSPLTAPSPDVGQFKDEYFINVLPRLNSNCFVSLLLDTVIVLVLPSDNRSPRSNPVSRFNGSSIYF